MRQLLLILLFLCSIKGSTQNVTPETAKVVAVNWYRHYAPQDKKLGNISKTATYKYRDATNFYIFSFDKGGFVMVSANNQAEPVLGYGFEGAVPGTIDNPAVKGMFDGYARQIDTLNVATLKSAKNNSKWEQLINNLFLKSGTKTTIVAPLLTTNWDQGWPYNSMCPANPNGPGGHAWVGCVGTAMAQIMKYHNYPSIGLGSYEYWNTSANFGATTYNWSNMPNSISTPNNDIAMLMYQTAVSTHTYWGATGSGVLSSNTKIDPMTSAFFNYFKYAISTLRFVTKDRFSESDWETLISNELINNRPVYYTGIISSGSHAWVCDGVDASNMFHFNWGWGGLYNGYFAFSVTNYPMDQAAIIGIKPNDGSTLITDTIWSGNITKSTSIGVPNGITISVIPGTEIKFAKDCKLQVFGRLLSIGTSDNYIKFTAIDTIAGWLGLKFGNEHIIDRNDSSKLIYSQIEYSKEHGLLFDTNVKAIVDHCIIKNNHIGELSGNVLYSANGGGIFLQENSINITNSAIYNNHAVGEGGGIAIVYNGNSPMKIFKNEIFSNKALDGGGVCLIAANEITLNENIFKKNQADRGSGAFLASSSNVLVLNNKFSNNIMGNGGSRGNLLFYNSDSRLVNNLISNNEESGIDCENSSPKIINNSIVNNKGNGINLYGNSDPIIKNCIIYKNQSSQVKLESDDSDPFFDHCDIQGGLNKFEGSGADKYYKISRYTKSFDSNPQFISPSAGAGNEYNGLSANWSLQSNSPCIDYGDITGVFGLLPTKDLESNPRIIRTLDLGAYESLDPPSQSPVVVISPESCSVCIGSNVILSAYIRGDSLSFKWTHNSLTIPGANSDSLEIRNITSSDVGNYQCIANNNYGCDTTLIANIKVIQVDPVEIGEIQGPDTLTWWQKSINYCVIDQPFTSFNWNISGSLITSSVACVNFMADDNIQSGLIKVKATNICGITDSIQKSIVINPFPFDKPFGILFGPSVVLRDDTVHYDYDAFGCDYDIDPFLIYSIGLEPVSSSGRIFRIANDAESQLSIIANWQRIKNNELLYSGMPIKLPITVVNAKNQLPKIIGPEIIDRPPTTASYSIDSLAPAVSYEWIWPEGYIPIENTSGRVIQFSITSTFKGGILKVRGINPNWRGPYYEMNIKICSPSSSDKIIGTTSVCTGQDSLVYSVPTISNASSYIWTLPNGAIGTSTTNSITVNYGTSAVSGEISVIGHNDCGDGGASSLAVTVNPLPFGAGTITGSAVVCAGQNSVTYSVQAIPNATSYLWTLPTGSTGTSTTNSIIVNYGSNAVSGNISVKGHNDCGDGALSTLALTVNPLVAGAGTITGSAVVCAGQNSVFYSVPAIPNATSYLWTLPTGSTGTSTTNSIAVNFGTSTVSGIIYVKGHNDCGDGAVSTLAITVNPLPFSSGTITGTTTVCQGQNLVSYTVPTITNATSYLWTLPTGSTGTSTTNSIIVNYGSNAVSGNITVKGHTDCGDGASGTLAITVNPLVAGAGTITGATTVCQGQNAVTYSVASIANATSYVWSLPSGTMGVSSTNSITVNYGMSAVSGNVTVKGHNGCGDGAASTLAVTVNPKPVTPVVTVTANILHSNALNGNQWYKSNSIITGAASQDYTFTAVGDYAVVVTQSGCASDPSVISVVTGLDPLDNSKKISVYPNPVTNELIIESEGNTQKIDFVIVSATGQVVYTGYLYEKVVIPTTGYATGLYFIKLKSGKIIEFKKIVKL